jgi:diguanylate cyclase (GGDEF)-like protein/putative nucleotidyltransferase with HDIG domain
VERADGALSLVVLDLDDFQRVNDALGHQAGDRALVAVARRLLLATRPGDAVGRLGGDEFGWLIAADEAAAHQAAERLRAAISLDPVDGVGSLTVSAGVCDLAQAGDAERLLALAQGALYWAKCHGRNAAVRYEREVVVELSSAERAQRLEQAATLASIRVLARAVDAKDSSTHEHSERVAALAARLAEELGWPAERVALLRDAGLVHDVGKIGVPDAVLLKPGRLDAAEYEVVKQHAALGAAIVSDVLSDEQCDWVRHHHERWSGQGYPAGLVGDDIPDGAQILALADAWDVMTGTERPYTQPKSEPEALAECLRERGRQFAPLAVDALARLLAEPGRRAA